MKHASKILRKAFLAAAFLGGTAGVAVAQTPPQTPTTVSAQAVSGERTLSFKIATGVAANGNIVYADAATHAVTYFRDGQYDKNALGDINALLTDREADKQAPQGIDPALMDLLYALKGKLQLAHPGMPIVFHVISGYRSPETNAHLRNDAANPYRASVAKNSEHMQAKAIDIFVPGISGEELRDTAWSLHKGGVGFYPQFKNLFPQGYIHVDTGKVRHWGFKP